MSASPDERPASLRVIAVDDSSIVLRLLEAILESAPDIRLVRTLSSLQDVELARALSCGDVAVVDMLMPGRSGLSALLEIAAQMPVVVVSDAAPDSEIAREALARGAAFYVSKRELGAPEGQERLRRVVREAASGRAQPATSMPITLVAGSTGAHRALARLIPALVHVEVRGVVLQHLPPGSDHHFVQWLSGLGIPARLASTGQSIEARGLMVAPAGQQLVLEESGRVRVRPNDGELHAPSADVLFASAACLGSRSTAVVLSGLGADGAKGAAVLASAGGRVFVQSPDDCVVGSMPEATLRSAPRARSLPIDLLAQELVRAHR